MNDWLNAYCDGLVAGSCRAGGRTAAAAMVVWQLHCGPLDSRFEGYVAGCEAALIRPRQIVSLCRMWRAVAAYEAGRRYLESDPVA